MCPIKDCNNMVLESLQHKELSPSPTYPVLVPKVVGSTMSHVGFWAPYFVCASYPKSPPNCMVICDSDTASI